MRLDRDAYLAAVQADGARVQELCPGQLEQPVPSCPGWLIRDAVLHLGFVHRINGSRLRRHSRSRDDRDTPTAPDDADLCAWFAEGVEQLLEVAHGLGPDTPIWNWSGTDPTAAFWFRRMAHETVVHRWDVEAALGVVSPIARNLAEDGVDEFFEVFWTRDREIFTGEGEWIRIQTLDGGQDWWVGALPGGAGIGREAPLTAAATTIGAAPPELFLGLWRRLPPEVLRIEGDQQLAARFLAAPHL
ncbi:MAG: maleylpyruvate isomerase family mycothiol-dependent enzyme [Candidatus Dormibacteria bacterium]